MSGMRRSSECPINLASIAAFIAMKRCRLAILVTHRDRVLARAGRTAVVPWG